MDLKNRVFESLDNAIVNGYELLEWSDQDIADDLHEYDAELENVDSAELLPLVAEWRAGK
jgi:ribosome-binding protein aMBF1 (putative translation factor)